MQAFFHARKKNITSFLQSLAACLVVLRVVGQGILVEGHRSQEVADRQEAYLDLVEEQTQEVQSQQDHHSRLDLVVGEPEDRMVVAGEGCLCVEEVAGESAGEAEEDKMRSLVEEQESVPWRVERLEREND